MAKKLFLSCVIIFTVLAAVFLAVGTGGAVTNESAYAAVDWTANVAILRDGKYVNLAQGARVSDATTFYFLISDYKESDAFQYYVSEGNDLPNTQDGLGGIADSGWSTFLPEDKTLNNEGKTCWTAAYTTANKTDMYVYFRRRFTEGSEVKTEYYNIRYQIIVNTSISSDLLGITEVKAEYLSGNKYVEYNGNWIGVGLRFTVKTLYMQTTGGAFDGSSELLSYSVDGKDKEERDKKWIPVTTGNQVNVNVSLKNGRVDFRVTDIGKKYAAYGSYGGVNVDLNTPVFNLTATTLDANTGLPKPYNDRDWSSNDVTFSFEDASNCISPVSYYYSTDGMIFNKITTGNFVVHSTMQNLRFRAVSAGNVTYDYNGGRAISVNIDGVVPGALADALTEDPEKAGNTINLPVRFDATENSYYATADANGKLYLNLYNKDRDGNYVYNASGAKVMYSVSIDGGEYGDYKQATSSITDGDNVYYRITDTILSGVATDRKYRFYVESGAGLRSNVTYFTVKILNSYFEIEVKDIKYTPNASGWASEAIQVAVAVPTDSKIIRDHAGVNIGKTEPTTRYTFVYSPTNISGVSYEAEGKFSAELSEEYREEDGISVYVFPLEASAESTFTVYAKNGAGKRSANTFVSNNVIKIDTEKPQADLVAYIKDGSGIYISNGDWVNGRIMLTLTVKDGISGVYVKDLNFAKDGNGNPVYNSAGELIWQESATVRTASGTETGEDGSRYFIYNIEIGLPESGIKTMSREYRYRVYTGSGVSIDKSFLANIDASEIILESIDFEYADKTERIEINSNSITLPSICEKGTVTLNSNSEQAGHFDYYVLNEITGKYELVEGNTLEFFVPEQRRGNLIKKFYLVSRAKDYNGYGVTSDIVNPYEIIVPYNTLNISITYKLLAGGSEAGSDKWMDDNLTVQVGLAVNDDGEDKDLSLEEKRNYSYYYMLIPYTSGDFNIDQAIKNGEWLPAIDGEYEAGSGSLYVFSIDFTDKSFYGYVALSVTNEAGFRSSTAGGINRLLRIDRTVPQISDMIVTASGTHETGMDTVLYYSKDPVKIVPKSFTDRSEISYYYIRFSDDDPVTATGVPTSDNLNGWEKLTSQIELTAESGYAEYNFVFYAVNALGSYSGGISGGSFVSYKFIIDSSAMTGLMAHSGGYFDQSLKMQAYIWEKDPVNVNLNVSGSNTEVMYYYSLDDGKTWIPYNGEYVRPTAEATTLRFDDVYFPEGVNSAFAFKAVNKAGTEFIYGEKIYIAIDTMTPEFKVLLTVDGAEYVQDDLNLVYHASNWSNRPVTITIVPEKVNVCGVKYEYSIEHAQNQGQQKVWREVPSDVTFTTDRLDGFGTNRDALITIRGTSRSANAASSEVTVRIKVDQTTPEFELKGDAKAEDNTPIKTLYSGDWANCHSVELVRENVAANVSNVTYTFTRRTGGSAEYWPEGNPVFTESCTITVTAVSDAGLTYERQFRINIDNRAPVIEFSRSLTEIEQFIDLRVRVIEENIEICEYITIKGDTRGFALDPDGYTFSTSSVDNTERVDPETKETYRGYVKVYVKDYAGNVATAEFYMLPFKLDVNNVKLDDQDRKTIDAYERDLNAAEAAGYMEAARVTYFRNLISRLRDRLSTLQNEIDSYRAYLEKLAQRTSFELKSDYWEMYDYLETFNNYALYNQQWIQTAIMGDESSVYRRYFENLQVQFGVLHKQMEMVSTIESQVIRLPAINMVEAEDYNDILVVYDLYSGLSSDQKACFTTNLYTKLLAVKKRCEILLLTDEETGVNLDADFAPDVRIKVETFSSQSEYYTNAQSAILNTVTDENAARAVVSIYRVSLVGEGSQTSTGTITVNLPIPEDYRQYVRFAVYEMGTDGTVSPVSGVKIEGDGKSVTFKSAGLTTYVLTAKANIQVNDKKQDVYGKFLGLDLDVEMIRTMAIIGATLFVVVIVVVIIAGIRHKRFLNTYNRAYKSSIYRKGIQRIPKGNTRPRRNPINEEERVKDQKKPY